MRYLNIFVHMYLYLVPLCLHTASPGLVQVYEPSVLSGGSNTKKKRGDETRTIAEERGIGWTLYAEGLYRNRGEKHCFNLPHSGG